MKSREFTRWRETRGSCMVWSCLHCCFFEPRIFGSEWDTLFFFSRRCVMIKLSRGSNIYRICQSWSLHGLRSIFQYVNGLLVGPWWRTRHWMADTVSCLYNFFFCCFNLFLEHLSRYKK
jgi:hypothetical protein